MLTVETIGRIRREHFIKGKTIREIARDLKVSRNTVRKVLRSGETSFEYERNVQPRPKLGRWTAELDELLSGNAAKPAREQLTLIRIFEVLCGRGYGGGYEIPNEMRDFAEKSVEQARKAFEGFLDAAYKASNTLETQATTAQDNVRAVAGVAVSFAEQNMGASFAYAQKLVRATSVEQVLAIQTEFAKQQIETLTKQVKEMSVVAGRKPDMK